MTDEVNSASGDFLLGPPIGAAAAFLGNVRAAAPACGITRLADITRLDRLGLPVWQAVRPAGKSLSVHQGKGASPLAAQIGALCEAIEAHCAENAPADGPLCPFLALPPEQRAPDFSDYCRSRDKVPKPSEAIQWCEARDLLTGAIHYLPHGLVSLDYRSGSPEGFERASAGLGAGASEMDALQTSLLEVIERDAVGEWHRAGEVGRNGTSLALETVPFDWFQAWRHRFAEQEIDLHAFDIGSPARIPIFMCVIGAVEEFGAAYRRFSGTAAHGDPELALFKALAEAIQSRLTLIAGVRDDILPSYYKRHATSRRDASALGLGKRKWVEVEPIQPIVETAAERLVELGYRTIAVTRLDAALDGVVVTKMFIPGLGSLSRTRRQPR